MSIKKLAILFVLVSFVIFSIWVVITGGSFAEIGVAFGANPWISQVTVDLVLALSMFCIWMWSDARGRGKNPVPWVIATLLTGSIGALTYLLVREELPDPASARG